MAIAASAVESLGPSFRLETEERIPVDVGGVAHTFRADLVIYKAPSRIPMLAVELDGVQHFTQVPEWAGTADSTWLRNKVVHGYKDALEREKK